MMIAEPRTTDEKSNERSGIQVIARAASILYALEGEPDGLSLGELAQRTSLARSTVQRIVGALCDEQMLISAGPRAGVTLGPALVRLAASANIETDKIVKPVMQELSRALGETVDLSVLQGRVAMFVDQVIGTSRLVAISSVGQSFPLHCTANGKALLTCIAADRRRALLRDDLIRFTPATRTDVVQIEADVADALHTHLAWDIEEHSLGICAVGTAFIDPLGRDFALSVPVPTARFEAKREEIADRIIAARDAIIRLLPGSRIPE
jgi:DNA-binding IclR family transcriptional regulator